VKRVNSQGFKHLALTCILITGLIFGLTGVTFTTAVARSYPDMASQPAEIQSAVDFVTNKGYMNGAGDGNFHPEDPVLRLEYAYSLVKLFKKQYEPVNPAIQFTDLKQTSSGYKYANIAVQQGYISPFSDGSFRPSGTLDTVSCILGLNRGLGMDGPDSPVFCAAGIWPKGPEYSGHSIVGSDLHLRYRGTRALPRAAYPRGELAYSIQKAVQGEDWRVDYVREAFTRIRCQAPVVGPAREKALDAAFSKIGYPYVWGGESDAEGGYDCSGLVYYVMQSVMRLPMMRTADDQAKDGRYPALSRQNLLPGDPIFFYGDTSSGYIGHAGIYVGRGLFIHSTGSNAGVSVDYLTDYWAENFACGKRVISEGDPETFDTYILLQNPGASTSRARLTYMLRDGRRVTEDRKLDPFSRRTVKVDDTLISEEFSTTVDALQGEVIAERSMYFRYLDRFPGGHSSPGSTGPSQSWFLAEGCTAFGFDTYILVQNPNDEPATVAVTFMTDTGKTVDISHTLGAESRYTFCVDKVPGMEEAQFATRVTSNLPVVVERSMYFDYNGVIAEGSNSQGLTYLSKGWYFAEGYTSGAFDTFLLLANPYDSTANVTLTLLADDGTRSRIPLSVRGHSRRTVEIDRLAGWGNRAFSMAVRSDLDVAAERAMYFDYKGIKGGHAALGCPAPGTVWYLAEGYTSPQFDTYVLISNPGENSARLAVRFMLNGGRFVDRKYRVAAHSRYTIKVNDVAGLANKEVSTLVKSSSPVVVERSEYFDYMGRRGGSCSPAVPGPAPRWYFAEGYSGR
jgi:NlpC/P60 family/S-layer homology domain